MSNLRRISLISTARGWNRSTRCWQTTAFRPTTISLLVQWPPAALRPSQKFCSASHQARESLASSQQSSPFDIFSSQIINQISVSFTHQTFSKLRTALASKFSLRSCRRLSDRWHSTPTFHSTRKWVPQQVSCWSTRQTWYCWTTWPRSKTSLSSVWVPHPWQMIANPRLNS